MLYDEHGNEIDQFTAFKEKKYTYNEVQKNLMLAKEGSKIKDLLKDSTICVAHNSSCDELMILLHIGYNPFAEPQFQEQEVHICPLGIGIIDDCPLSK